MPLTVHQLTIALLLVIPLVLFLRLLVPYLWGLFHRVRITGPAGVGSPNSGGRWLGWVVGMFWSLFESKREETYEYSRLTRVQRWNEGPQGPRIQGLPRPASDPEPLESVPGHSLMSRDHQQLTEDGRHWWTGRQWVSVDDFVPPSAPRSVDGSHWWDGVRWQWMPGEFPRTRSSLPQRAKDPVAAVSAAPTSWLEARTAHQRHRWSGKIGARRDDDRSDPPPRGMPPFGGEQGPRRRWFRRAR
jgi:hypothetical protein